MSPHILSNEIYPHINFALARTMIDAMEKLVGDISQKLVQQTTVADNTKNLTAEDTAKLTLELKPELLRASRLRRRMKRDLLLRVEEEQQQAVRELSARSLDMAGQDIMFPRIDAY